MTSPISAITEISKISEYEFNELAIFHKFYDDAFNCIIDLIPLNSSKINIIIAPSASLFVSLEKKYGNKFEYNYLSTGGTGNRIDFDVFSALKACTNNFKLSSSAITNIARILINSINQYSHNTLKVPDNLFQYFMSSLVEALRSNKNKSAIESWIDVLESNFLNEKIHDNEKQKILRKVEALMEGQFLDLLPTKEHSFKKFLDTKRPKIIFINSKMMNELGSYLLMSTILVHISDEPCSLYDLSEYNFAASIYKELGKFVNFEKLRIASHFTDITNQNLRLTKEKLFGQSTEIDEAEADQVKIDSMSDKALNSLKFSMRTNKPNEFILVVESKKGYDQLYAEYNFNYIENAQRIIFDEMQDRSKPWIYWIPFNQSSQIKNNLQNLKIALEEAMVEVKNDQNFNLLFRESINIIQNSITSIEKTQNILEEYESPCCDEAEINFLEHNPKCSNCQKAYKVQDLICDQCNSGFYIPARILNNIEYCCNSCIAVQ